MDADSLSEAQYRLDFLLQSDDWRYFCQAANDCVQMETGGGGIFVALGLDNGAWFG